MESWISSRESTFFWRKLDMRGEDSFYLGHEMGLESSRYIVHSSYFGDMCRAVLLALEV